MPVGNLVTINFSPTRGGRTQTWDVSDANITALISTLDGAGAGAGTNVQTSSYTYLGKVTPEGVINDTATLGGGN